MKMSRKIKHQEIRDYLKEVNNYHKKEIESGYPRMSDLFYEETKNDTEGLKHAKVEKMATGKPEV